MGHLAAPENFDTGAKRLLRCRTRAISHGPISFL